MIRLALAAALLLIGPAVAETHRSAPMAAFQRTTPCPSNGATRGACPGYVIDHVKPRCAGGPDQPSNMQWQTVAEAKIKDRAERAQCRSRP